MEREPSPWCRSRDALLGGSQDPASFGASTCPTAHNELMPQQKEGQEQQDREKEAKFNTSPALRPDSEKTVS